MEDQYLIASVLEGKKSAFEQLVVKYERLVATMVFRYVDSVEDREELMQDIFMKVYSNLSSFQQKSKLSTWIATIAYRQSIEFLRKRKLSFSEELENLNIAVKETSYETKDVSEYVKEMISRLPPIYASIITLYHIEGFSYEEIAEIMDLPLGTVKNYLFRARKKLKEILGPVLEKEQLLYE